jgi:hypothetical protein
LLTFLILAQAAAAQLPDIELKANVRARSLTISKQGEARLTVRTEPEGANLVDVKAPKANGRKTINNVSVDVRAEARIADISIERKEAETVPPQ